MAVTVKVANPWSNLISDATTGLDRNGCFKNDTIAFGFLHREKPNFILWKWTDFSSAAKIVKTLLLCSFTASTSGANPHSQDAKLRKPPQYDDVSKARQSFAKKTTIRAKRAISWVIRTPMPPPLMVPRSDCSVIRRSFGLNPVRSKPLKRFGDLAIAQNMPTTDGKRVIILMRQCFQFFGQPNGPCQVGGCH